MIEVPIIQDQLENAIIVVQCSVGLSCNVCLAEMEIVFNKNKC